MQEIKVSVIIPNFNRSELLKKAIASVLNQSYAVLEILVCDDGSTDNSKEIVEQFNHQIVKWIDCGKNGRPAIPRNIGVKQAQGNYIAFLDNDDEWLPTKTEEQVKLIIEKKALIVCTNAYKVSAMNCENYFKNTLDCIYTFNDLFNTNYIICSSIVLQKDLLINTSLFPEEPQFKAIEDYALWLRLSTLASIYYLSKPLVNYKDDTSTSIRKTYNTIEEIREVIYPDLNNWLIKKKIALTSKNQLNLKYQLTLIKRNYRLSFLDKLYFKIKRSFQ